MMECKKALTEADGDMAKAEELLRVKLGTKAGKGRFRVTAEGVVALYIDGTWVPCGSEQKPTSCPRTTASSPWPRPLQAGAKHNPATLKPWARWLRARQLRPHLEDVRKGLIGKDRRKHVFRRFKHFSGSTWLPTCTARALAWWSSSKGDATAAAKDVAMHMAAMKPVALTSADVPADLIEKGAFGGRRQG